MTELTDSGFEEKIKESKYLVVKLTASWCGACKAIAHMFCELADLYSDDIDCATLDIDSNPEASTFFEVTSIPAIIFIKNGVIVNKIIGATPKSKLDKEFKILLT